MNEDLNLTWQIDKDNPTSVNINALKIKNIQGT